MFKPGQNKPNPSLSRQVLTVETLHVLGVCMFVYRVLPLLDNVVQGDMLMLGVSFLPSLLNVLECCRGQPAWKSTMAANFVAWFVQLSALVVYPILKVTIDGLGDVEVETAWTLPISLLLISLGWWENYVDANTMFFGMASRVLSVRDRINRTRTKTYLIVSAWKVVVAFLFMLAFVSRDLVVTSLFNFDFRSCAHGKTTMSQVCNTRFFWRPVALMGRT